MWFRLSPALHCEKQDATCSDSYFPIPRQRRYDQPNQVMISYLIRRHFLRTYQHCSQISCCPLLSKYKIKTKQDWTSFPHSYVTSYHNSAVFWAVGDNNSCRDKSTKLMHLYSARTIMCLCVHSVPKMPFDLIQGRSSMRLNGDFTRLPSRKEAAAGLLSLFNHGVFVSWLRWGEVTVVVP